MSSSIEELERILKEFTDEDLMNLPEEDFLKYKKELNPYGRTIQGSDKLVNFSITNWGKKYMEKLILTSLIGYLNRANDEWEVPKSVPVVPVYEYLEDVSKCDMPKTVAEGKDEIIKKDWEFNKEWMKKRVIVKEFLETVFQFNPDEHVRSAYRPNRKDIRRKPIHTKAAKLAIEHTKLKDKSF